MTLVLLRRLLALKFHRPKNILGISTGNCAEEIYEEKPSHIPVMVNEVVEHLNLKEGNVFLDMTFGAGGHSAALLERIPNLEVIALDRDPISQPFAEKLERLYPGQVTALSGKFSDLPELLEDTKLNSIDGMLFDLGCSSMQFDYAERGFSVSKEGPLDMRMDGDRLPDQLTAADVVAFASETDLYHLFKKYGEERKSKKIAQAIIEARNNSMAIKTTKDLVELIESVCSNVRSDKLGRPASVATKVFQALRIFVNNEINELNYGLILAHKYLKLGGRAVAISFHSLEDTIVKSHFSNQLIDNCKKALPLLFVNEGKTFSFEEVKSFQKKLWEPINKKVLLPTEEEISSNPRSRSAKLRAAIKI